jgi:iron complex outermembrane recepter protein
MGLKVTVASRREESIQDAPAAVYVITGDEIRRSGHTTVQEALRMVPGFHVAQWKSSGWDVTSRGFTGGLSALNESFSNQMLVMIDGVSVYSPAMAGIWWPLLDIPIQDIDRIEVVRGPAGTLWGANAVNGVVNVITKNPEDTQGKRVSTQVSNWETSGDASYGGRMGDNGTYRLWTSYSRYDPLKTSEGKTFPEDWWIASLGWRGDWALADDRHLRIQTSMYTSEFGEELWNAGALDYYPWDNTPKNGGYILGSYEVGTSGDMTRWQAWYSADYQKQIEYTQNLQTVDLEYTRQKDLSDQHSLTWGIGGRWVFSDLTGEGGYIDFNPRSRTTVGLRAFFQDQIKIEGTRSSIIVGAQLEDHTFTDLELQPNLRWLFTATDKTTVWASISRAVRTPSLEEVDIVQRIDNQGPIGFEGNPNFKTEEVLSFELGARSQLTDGVYLDLATFYNDFGSLQSLEVDETGQYLTFGNKIKAKAYGLEAALDVDLTEDWRLRSAFSTFLMDFTAGPESWEAGYENWRDSMIPERRFNLRSYYDINDEWELDVMGYWTDENSTYFFENPSYTRVDVRLGWNPSKDLQIGFGVRNLTSDQHSEAGTDITWYGSEVERTLFATLSWSF